MADSKERWTGDFVERFLSQDPFMRKKIDTDASRDLNRVAKRLYECLFDSEFDFVPGYLNLDCLRNHGAIGKAFLDFLAYTYRGGYIQRELEACSEMGYRPRRETGRGMPASSGLAVACA